MNHMRAGNYKAAQSLLDKLTSARPMLAGSQANLGLVYFHLGDLEKSASAAAKALQINPRLAKTHFLLGLLKTKQHDYAGAEKHYHSAIELDKNYTNAHYNLALLYDVYFQQPDKSLPYYKTYLRLTPQRDQQTQDWINHLESSLKKGSERR